MARRSFLILIIIISGRCSGSCTSSSLISGLVSRLVSAYSAWKTSDRILRGHKWPVSSKNAVTDSLVSLRVIPGNNHAHTANDIFTLLNTAKGSFPLASLQVPELKFQRLHISKKDRTFHMVLVINVDAFI